MKAEITQMDPQMFECTYQHGTMVFTVPALANFWGATCSFDQNSKEVVRTCTQGKCVIFCEKCEHWSCCLV